MDTLNNALRTAMKGVLESATDNGDGTVDVSEAVIGYVLNGIRWKVTVELVGAADETEDEAVG